MRLLKITLRAGKTETEKIRPVGYLKLTETSKTHISELIRRETSVGPGDRIPFVINARAVLLYDPGLTAEELIASINVLKDDIVLRRRVTQGTVTTPMKIKEG